MNTEHNPESLIYAIVADKKHLARVSRGQRFRDDLGVTSMDALEIIMQVEDCFQIEIPDEDSEQLATVGDLVDDVSARLRQS